MERGRPSSYKQEMADSICEALSQGVSLRSVCAREGMPNGSTVFRWIREREDFRQQYARSKEESADAMAEDMLDIADDGTNDLMTIEKGDKTYNVEDREVVNRSKLRVDTRKWLMAKMKPKKYGDKLDVTTNGKDLPIPLLNAIRDNDGDKKDSVA